MNGAALPFVVAIGASGGEGLDDIRDLLGALPPTIASVVMVVLHRPSDKISSLREVLALRSNLPVIVAAEAEKLMPGNCYIGEPGGHLTLVLRNSAHLVRGSGNRLRNRTVDTLFVSLARHAAPRIVGVILSGSLDDGSRGLAAIHAAHGLTMVLDPGQKPRGMQQNAIDYDGPISLIGDADEIAAAIAVVVGQDGNQWAPSDGGRR